MSDESVPLPHFQVRRCGEWDAGRALVRSVAGQLLRRRSSASRPARAHATDGRTLPHPHRSDIEFEMDDDDEVMDLGASLPLSDSRALAAGWGQVSEPEVEGGCERASGTEPELQRPWLGRRPALLPCPARPGRLPGTHPHECAAELVAWSGRRQGWEPTADDCFATSGSISHLCTLVSDPQR